MNIFSILKKDPDQAVQVLDDKQALLFLRQLGIADAFSHESSLSEQPTVQICGFDGIKTHFVVAFFFSGLPKKKDNGYVISCAPRCGFAPGLLTSDFVAGASHEQALKGLRIIVRTPPSHN